MLQSVAARQPRVGLGQLERAGRADRGEVVAGLGLGLRARAVAGPQRLREREAGVPEA